MSNIYVYSGAAGSNNGTSWANAYTTLAAAASASFGGDDIWVAHDHAESTAGAVTITPGSGSGARVICVNRAGSVPPVAADLRTTATVTTTGNNGITVRFPAYFYGIGFVGGSGASGALNIVVASTHELTFEACSFKLATTGIGARIAVGAAGGQALLNNCTMEFGSTSQGVYMQGNATWRNKPGSVAITGATIPATLFQGNGIPGAVLCSGLDLSALGSGKTLVDGNNVGAFKLVNCKLNASVTVAAGLLGYGYQGPELIGCHSTSNARRDERSRYEGALTTETTIKRTAGASDGTTTYCWKLVTTGNAKRYLPFETFEGALWNSATGSSKTLTVHVVTDNVTLKDDEIWLEAEYLGDSGYPVATLITDANATVLTAGANQTSDSATSWTTTGLGTPVKQKLEVTFTPQMAGPVRWRVCVGKASATVYVCPKAELT